MRLLIVLYLLASCTILKAQSTAPLSPSRTIPLGGIGGRFDHLAIDAAGNRLFIAATGNHSVEVVDLKTDKVEQSIAGLDKPHGLAWVAATESLYVADGALAELRVYRGTPLALAGKIKLSDDADDMVFDEAKHLLFVGHGAGDGASQAQIAVVDTERFSLVANLPVASHPEALDIDPASRRVFANIAGANEVAIIDTATKTISSHWKLTKCGDNVPMAFGGDGLLYLACRNPGMLVALDVATGKEVATQPAAGGADDLFYDAALRRVYLVSGEGEVDVFQSGQAKTLSALGVLHTAAGAKTALFVPSQHLLYVGVPGAAGHPAEIRVYAVGANGETK
jgi:DNA-binding beta-propeller fold protein YncE